MAPKKLDTIFAHAESVATWTHFASYHFKRNRLVNYKKLLTMMSFSQANPYRSTDCFTDSGAAGVPTCCSNTLGPSPLPHAPQRSGQESGGWCAWNSFRYACIIYIYILCTCMLHITAMAMGINAWSSISDTVNFRIKTHKLCNAHCMRWVCPLFPPSMWNCPTTQLARICPPMRHTLR